MTEPTSLDFQRHCNALILEFDGNASELQRFTDALILVNLNKK